MTSPSYNASKGSFSGSDGDSSYTLTVTPDSNSTGTITVVSMPMSPPTQRATATPLQHKPQDFDTTPTDTAAPTSSAATSTDGSKETPYNETSTTSSGFLLLSPLTAIPTPSLLLQSLVPTLIPHQHRPKRSDGHGCLCRPILRQRHQRHPRSFRQ